MVSPKAGVVLAIALLGCSGDRAAPAPATAPSAVMSAAPIQSRATAPSVRGYHALLAMGSRGVLLLGGWNARPASGELQKEVWTLRGGKWGAATAELPFYSDVAVWDPDAARAVIITDVGAAYLYDPVTDRWERRATSGGPRAVDSLRGAYDPKARRVLVFGGADTWAYDVSANSWTPLSPGASAPPRRWAAVVHHSRSDVFVMFGGNDLADTWTYDAGTNEWKEMKPARAPSGRKYHAMAYDEGADRIVLFGGAPGPQGGETPLGDTWTYDLARNEWTEVRPATGPTMRGWHAMAYDAVLGRVVLYGGGPHRDQYRAETWMFDSRTSSWSQLTTSP